jgi:hypothetical protein
MGDDSKKVMAALTKKIVVELRWEDAKLLHEILVHLSQPAFDTARLHVGCTLGTIQRLKTAIEAAKPSPRVL